MTVDSVHIYIQSLEKELAAGETTEHTHRPALKTLLESLNTAITATNEPQHITSVGAPDFRIIKNKLAIGYVECKDIDKNLDDVLETDQLTRYLHSFHNLLLTDYLEFRWYVGGKLRLNKTLGTLVKGKIKQDKDSLQEVTDGLTSFLNNEPEPIGSPKELAGHMARLAHMIREIIINALKKELVTGSLHAQWQAFRENLIPELSVEQFADMYSQTIAYGLFAARCETDNGKDFTRQQAAYLIPKTNPFLRKLFNYIAGPELDESITWAVEDLAQILAWADMEAVLKDFGKSTGKADPVVHFYETFLKEYDPKTREMRGVYYTPLPIVSYIVRSIDHILKTSFDKPQGLVDPSVLVLDPAVGTATFLYMVMQEIHDAVIQQGQGGTWNDYVMEKLLPRIFGFEILMAPYAIAHLKLGRLLKETNYQFLTDQRLGVYLTNTLEEAVKHSETMFAQWITEEANAAADIKKTKPIMIVLGNPPYSENSANKGRWINDLIETYRTIDGKPLDERNPKALQDDYVKFIRFGQWRVDKTGQGILGFISNHTYLDNPAFRGMRKSLMNSFDQIFILDLHGNVRKKEFCPDGTKDENVFDIQQGVTIGIFVKKSGVREKVQVYHADIWGKREAKYQTLSQIDIDSTEWLPLEPCSPFYLFTSRAEEFLSEYEKGWKITEILSVNSDGVKTHRDHFVVAFNSFELKARIGDFIGTNLSDNDFRDKFGLAETSDWNVSDARKALRSVQNWEKRIRVYSYRPFDVRYVFYDDLVIGRARTNIMRHMLKGNNLALSVGRAGQVVGQGTWDLLFCSKYTEDCNLFYRGGTVNLPLYLYPHPGEMQFEKGRRPNINPEFIKGFAAKLDLVFVNEGKGDLIKTFGPEDIFNYAYAIFQSPNYRERYAEFLKIDFPRLPLASDKTLFKSLVGKGTALVSLHLMESPLLNTPITKYPVDGAHEVEKAVYEEKLMRVNINKTEYFEGVPPEVWNFHIGGYQVCDKWLKDRKGRKLSIDDISHYQKIVVALKETIRLMKEIDELIEQYGGWPGAFK